MLWRMIRRLFKTAVIVYVGLCVILYFAQDWIAFPGKTERGKPETHINYGRDVETLQLQTANGIPIAAVFGRALKLSGEAYYSANDHRPSILYFYGNAGSVAYSEGEFDHFRQLGYNVLIPDLAGYGDSGGNPSEANFYATADAAWDYLQSRPGIDTHRIIVVGWSMGAGVAIDLASRKPVAGLATFNAFTSLPEMAHHLLPFMPTSLLLRHRFENEKKITRIHCPMLICNGKLDTLVPPEMSDRLADNAGGPVTRLVIPQADHNTIFSANPMMVWESLDEFIEKCTAQ